MKLRIALNEFRQHSDFAVLSKQQELTKTYKHKRRSKLKKRGQKCISLLHQIKELEMKN